jgi:hypothetical protein
VKADKEVYFPDPNLEAAVRMAINEPSWDIYQSDLDTMDWLIAPKRGILNLSGLEYATTCGTWTSIPTR